MRSSTNLRKLVLTGSSAMNRRPTSSINIRNFIGTASVRIYIPLSATSTLPQVGVGGLPASTATYFVPSVNFAFRARKRSGFYGYPTRRAEAVRGDLLRDWGQ